MNRPPWKARRRRIDLALVFCAVLIVWMLWRGDDTALASSAINACFLLAGTLLSVYTGAAVVDDRNVMQHMGPQAFEDEEPLP
ncbi:MAG: hypothetical protein H5U12_01140 [Hoeflea sp.]|nr:hypothetical protein [Hoeflea sp.]